MLEENRIHFGDCLELMPEIPEKSIDFICCDLPYGVTNNPWDVVIPFDRLWPEYERIIKDDGAIALFAQGLFAAKLMLSNEKLYRYDLVWKKGERVSGFLDANRKPLRNHELILLFYKKQPTYNPQFTQGKPLHGKGKSYLTKKLTNNNYGKFKATDDVRKGTTQKYPKSVLDFKKPHPAKHPNEKPVALCEWLIKTYTNPGELVLDNTAGISTTGVAARNTGRRFVLIENKKEYYDMSVNRLKQTETVSV
jgi:site-specific DNA-methyltransferase (adenine-specific)